MSRSVISTTALMASGTLASRVLGFVRAALIAVVLGNGSRPAEAFNLANTIPNSLYILLAGGVMNAVLVPQIVRAMDEDEDGGEAYTNRIMTAFLAALGVLTVLVTVAAPWIMQIYTAEGWREPAMQAYWHNMVVLAYLCLPEVFFYGATVLVGQVLNSRQVYIPYMWAPIANNVISIAVFGLYLVVWGSSDGQPFTMNQMLLLGLGSTAGIAAQFFMLLPFLRRAGFRYRPRWDLRGVGLGHTFKLAQWTLYFVLVNQLAIFVVNRLGSTAVLSSSGSGAGITAYQTASLIWIVPHSLITLSLATQMMTSSSRLAAEGDMAGVAEETEQTMRRAMTVIVPSAIAFLALAFPISHLMFGNGAGARDSDFIGRTLLVMALGLVPYSLHYLVIRSFYALEDTRTPFYIQSTIVATNIVLAMALVLPFNAPGWVAAGLGGAYALSYVVGLTIAVALLRRKLPELRFGRVAGLLVRLTVASAPAGLLAWLVMRFTAGHGQLLLLGSLVLAGAVAVGIFLLMARTLHIEEVSAVVDALTRRRGGKPVEAAAPSSTAEQEGSVVADRTDEGHGPARGPSEPAVDQALEDDRAEHVGRLLGGRFRLEETLRPGRNDLWRATDLTLKRSVVCQFFPADDERSPLLLAAAKRAAQVTDSRFVRILDFADGAEPYVVREFAPGLALSTLLADGPLTGIEAAWLVREVADALASVHAQDRYHQRLDPDAVTMTDTGNVKIVGFQIDEALLPPTPDTGVEGAERTDVFDLGRLLYACLTGYWPGGPAHGLPDAPRRGAMWLSPRDVRPDVPPALDRITQQVIGGVSPLMADTTGRPAITTAAGLVAALSSVLGVTDASYRLEQRVRGHRPESPMEATAIQAPVPADPQTGPQAPGMQLFSPAEQPLRVVPRSSPRRGWVLGLLVLVALAIVVGLIGVAINTGRNGAVTPPGSPDVRTPSPAATAPWPIVDATTFDPTADGGNGDENPGTAALAYDGDPTTGWRTMQYIGDPRLGKLKPGVGLILDLGQQRSVGSVKVDVFGTGSTIEVRVPSDPAVTSPPMDSANSWRVLTTATDASGTVELRTQPAEQTRYVMLYFTRLAPDGGSYRGGVNEVQVEP
ncbi:murein biosynthesis integral membrane protein MurJ [Raineyella antarctica]|uniref:Murein biosynthesis integral membrane protein MurJ n=1 Tax=Raineyella antarctica TaxID=1577474 RepID=A0A1G6HSG0_9ACTN|nr:murein biosynthesis integral membrane protein MurJ [Raineyella antarctica]SDB97162.1 murein biosynthesis integral membrane protein MurJ [Raineyella antarctica]